MIIKVVLLCTLACNAVANDGLLNVLYGVHGLNKMSICMGPVKGKVTPAPLGACAGALWRRGWGVARASCVLARPADALAVLRLADGVTCYDLNSGVDSPYVRKVRAQYVHPKYVGLVSPQYNLALLALDLPYETTDVLGNTSHAQKLLAEFEPWMEEVYRNIPTGATLPQRSYMQRKGVFSSPMRMFITTVVLPSTCFMVFSLFITFFTSPKNRIAYKDYRCKEELNLI